MGAPESPRHVSFYDSLLSHITSGGTMILTFHVPSFFNSEEYQKLGSSDTAELNQF